MYKILLVDDEPAIMEAERRTISRHSDSFTVCGEAFSVEQAIRLIEEQRPQVVLTDMKMPKQNGTELIRYIGRLEDQMIVSVAVSGYSDFAYVHDAFSYGAYDYLLKPVEPRKLTELLGRIRELLDNTIEKPEEKSGMHTGRMTEEETAEEIIRYISDHLREDNSIVRICTRFAINQPYLSRIFRKVKGCTYNDYLNGVRIQKAEELLLSDRNYLIGEIAEMSGFSDQFYFSRVFKNVTGTTPSEFRAGRKQ
jgi:two-component system response regulator YesN